MQIASAIHIDRMIEDNRDKFDELINTFQDHLYDIRDEILDCVRDIDRGYYEDFGEIRNALNDIASDIWEQ